MIYPRPYGRGFFFIEIKATENYWKQTNGERGKFFADFLLAEQGQTLRKGYIYSPLCNVCPISFKYKIVN